MESVLHKPRPQRWPMSGGSLHPAAIYCRISHDAEGQGLGVARQERSCRRLATNLGLTD